VSDANWKPVHGGESHYAIASCKSADGMELLREMFPKPEANEMNFVLFSTSGVHGTYSLIEDAEKEGGAVTFVIVKPRTVMLQYGNCIPETADDFAYLKALRESSWRAVQQIGAPSPSAHEEELE
jgi:hypothetical protein